MPTRLVITLGVAAENSSQARKEILYSMSQVHSGFPRASSDPMHRPNRPSLCTMTVRDEPAPPRYEEIELEAGPAPKPEDQPNPNGQQPPTPDASQSGAVPAEFNVPRPRFRTRVSWHWNRFIVGLPVGFFVFVLVFSGCVYGIHYAIQNSGPKPDPARWMGEARRQVYEPCYLGCSHCDDPKYAWKACARSAGARVCDENGELVSCAATSMWNWPEHDRYPAACLEAVGEELRMEEFRNTAHSARGHYGWIVLAFFAALICAGIGHECHESLTAGCAVRVEQMKPEMIPWLKAKEAMIKRNSNTPANNRPANKPTTAATAATASRTLTASTGATVAAALALAGQAQAHPCVKSTTRDHRVHFTNPNGTIAGVVWTWMGDCGYGWDCGIDWVDCVEREIYLKQPVHLVEAVMPRIQACGFEASKEGTDRWQMGHFANQRLAHPGIEKNWWVQIKVTGLNVTRPDETDASVQCLYDIGGRLDY